MRGIYLTPKNIKQKSFVFDCVSGTTHLQPFVPDHVEVLVDHCHNLVYVVLSRTPDVGWVRRAKVKDKGQRIEGE